MGHKASRISPNGVSHELVDGYCAPPRISADVGRHSNAHRLIAGASPIDGL
jgi:hypothetical protein